MEMKILDIYRKCPQVVNNYYATLLPKHIYLGRYKCVCNEQIWYKKGNKKEKQKNKKRRKARLIEYPYKGPKFLYTKNEPKKAKTFQIYYDRELSIITKFTLTSFQNKYLYYALEDLKSNLFSNEFEKNIILSAIYNAILFLHNNECTNLFDIWIGNIYIQEDIKNNRLMNSKFKPVVNYTKITLVLFYKIQLPRKKLEPLW